MERPVKFLASLSADSVTDMELIKSRISDFKGYGLDGFVFCSRRLLRRYRIYER